MSPHSREPAPSGALPEADTDAQAHSDRLRALIDEEMEAAGGRLDFARFMELALYAPGLGYYSAGSRKFGPAGDFVTAPEISPLFSRCLARQCADLFESLGTRRLLEFGAGSGVMAADILRELARLGALPDEYLVMELSADLRARQAALIGERVPEMAGRVRWLDTLPGRFDGVMLANEVVDAMPVHRFRIERGQARECFVVAAGEGWGWSAAPPSNEVVAGRLAELQQRYALAEGYESELNLRAEEWLRTLAVLTGRGVLLIIDYGFPAREYYHPQRATGTLMCHFRHRAHGDPLLLPGLQDITAHVDFTALAEAGTSAGFDLLGFASQANFLIANGLAELALSPTGDVREQLELAAQVKRLTLPGEMGELFKVMALGKGCAATPRGFALRDERVRL